MKSNIVIFITLVLILAGSVAMDYAGIEVKYYYVCFGVLLGNIECVALNLLEGR